MSLADMSTDIGGHEALHHHHLHQPRFGWSIRVSVQTSRYDRYHRLGFKFNTVHSHTVRYADARDTRCWCTRLHSHVGCTDTIVSGALMWLCRGDWNPSVAAAQGRDWLEPAVAAVSTAVLHLVAPIWTRLYPWAVAAHNYVMKIN